MVHSKKALLALAVLWPAAAFAWGPQGHQVVAHLAAAELNPHARAMVGQLLGGEAEAMMALNATWADEIRQARPETGSWHYVNIEIDRLTYMPSRDCPQQACVIAQIVNAQRLLQAASSLRVKQEALRYLIHFVADVHMPLHGGQDHDRGGNMVDVRLGNKRRTLHSLWDGDVVRVLGPDARIVAKDIRRRLRFSEYAALAGGNAPGWALESARLARDAIYRRLPPQRPVRLNERYLHDNAALTRMQLAKAGIRLAMMLNRIWPQGPR